MLQTAFPHRSSEVLEDQARALTELDVAILDATLNVEIAQRDEIMARFAEVSCPTLIMQADPRILAAANDDDVAAIQARLKDSQHVKFEGADHDLHLWKPDQILTTVQDFLAA